MEGIWWWFGCFKNELWHIRTDGRALHRSAVIYQPLLLIWSQFSVRRYFKSLLQTHLVRYGYKKETRRWSFLIFSCISICVLQIYQQNRTSQSSECNIVLYLWNTSRFNSLFCYLSFCFLTGRVKTWCWMNVWVTCWGPRVQSTQMEASQQAWPCWTILYSSESSLPAETGRLCLHSNCDSDSIWEK